MASIVQNQTKNFFRVDWSGDIDTVLSNCTSIPSCRLAVDGECICDVTVKNEQVFYDQGSGPWSSPTRSDVLTQLHVGAFDPSMPNPFVSFNVGGVVKKITANGTLTSESVFEVVDDFGVRRLRKNVRSSVQIVGHNASFRNPVHFVQIVDGSRYEMQAETDAALDHYFYHKNMAPFLALRFAQRFGISNPTPGFISRIATAFRTGSFTFTTGGQSFQYGSQKYGDIAAMVACILLDRESRTPLLDADPAHGSLKEPLIKLIGLMRSLEFRPSEDVGFVEFDVNLNTKIGQMAHAIPNVFSFFLSEHQPPGAVAQASLVAPEAQILTGPRTINYMNGLISLIKYGLSPCYGGFGTPPSLVTVDCSKFVPGANNEYIRGKLTYSPANPTALVDELATLLTSGRLSQANRNLIREVVQTEANQTLALIKAQQLIAFSPEFHSTNIARNSGQSRPIPPMPVAPSKPYKAVVYILLSGGMDSFNLLAPHVCSSTNDAGQTPLQQYYAERGGVAISATERTRVINATGQPCSRFVIHQDLGLVERLYNEGDLAFFTNAGVLNRPSTKLTWWENSRTVLFGHNSMQAELRKIDAFDGKHGTGFLGRMCDTLQNKGFIVKPVSIEDATVATVGVAGSGIEPMLVSPYGTTSFIPKPSNEAFDMKPIVAKLNNVSKLQSSVFGETWSARLDQGIIDNQALLQTLSAANLSTTFPSSNDGDKLKSVATLIATHTLRGTDRDAFYVDLVDWDHHSELKSSLSSRFKLLNSALTAFEQEMKSRGYWNNVTVVITSDFGRTITPNSGNGTDHGWGGNYFMMGGSVKGGRINGDYPLDITDASPINLGRGRILPTMSWESLLNPVAQWMGVQTEAELNYCLPNRLQAGTQLLQMSDVFD